MKQCQPLPNLRLVLTWLRAATIGRTYIDTYKDLVALAMPPTISRRVKNDDPEGIAGSSFSNSSPEGIVNGS